jgi:hypothetical protein
MNPRQWHALLIPYTDPATQDIAAYRTVSVQPDGNLLLAVLAVDR